MPIGKLETAKEKMSTVFYFIPTLLLTLTLLVIVIIDRTKVHCFVNHAKPIALHALPETSTIPTPSVRHTS
jgi:hypothetical protein